MAGVYLCCLSAPLRGFSSQWFHKACSSAVKNAARMAKSTSTGVSSKTAASQVGAFSRGKRFTLASSMADRRPPGARRSNSPVRIPANLLRSLLLTKTVRQPVFPRETYQLSRSGSRACACSIRVNGERVGSAAYCLQVTLKARLRKCAGGLTPGAVLEKFAAIQMLDVHLPTTDGWEIVMSRYTQPEKDLCLLLDQMNLTVPEQAPPKIYRPDSNLN